MKVQVNGDPMDLTPGLTLTQLLEQLSLRPELVVVEHNLTILKRDQLADREIQEGDTIEIVHFVGGGCV